MLSFKPVGNAHYLSLLQVVIDVQQNIGMLRPQENNILAYASATFSVAKTTRIFQRIGQIMGSREPFVL